MCITYVYNTHTHTQVMRALKRGPAEVIVFFVGGRVYSFVGSFITLPTANSTTANSTPTANSTTANSTP